MEVGCIKNVTSAPHGRAYDLCPAVHAEENAIINSNRTDRIDAKLYLAGFDSDGKYAKAIPCQRCKRKIINSEISDVVVLDDTGNPALYDVEDWIQEDSDWYIKELNRVG
jgi:dCMP deaminase